LNSIATLLKNDEIGFALLNKPGGMPTNSTKTNHAEDVASMYGAALKERHGDKSTKHISIPLRAETEMNGLLLVSTKREFCSYMHEQLDAARGNDLVAENCGVAKTYKCLVCIKHPSDIDRIEKLMNRDLTHWVNVKSACPKTFTRTKPTNPKLGDWQKCVMRITSIGDEKFRAACVSSKYNDSNDYTLAHRLWDPRMEMPAEEVGSLLLHLLRDLQCSLLIPPFSIISVGRIVRNASRCSVTNNKTSSNPRSAGGVGLSNCWRCGLWRWLLCDEDASSHVAEDGSSTLPPRV